jgi:outer membrane protein assembly factor BamB
MNSRTKVAVCVVSVLIAALCGADWPHWQGPNRNGVVAEPSGFDGRAWPLTKLWDARVGDGSTSPIVVGDKLYTLGHSDGRDTIACLDAASGKTLWSVDYAAPAYGRKANGDEGMYRGPSSTPSFDNATLLLYTLGIDGELVCWNAARQGERVWRVNLYDAYDPPQRPKVGRSGQRDYGYTTAPLVHGDWVIVEVGAAAGNLMAFDKQTGERRWASENRDPAGHAGCLAPLTVDGVPCVAVKTFEGLVVTRIDAAHAGKQVAFVAWKTDFANSIASPAVHGNRVVITSDYNHGKIACYEITLGGAREVWKVDHSSTVCTPVIHDGCVYWCWQKVHCLDLTTGKAKWIGPANLGDPGSCIVTSDDRLIVWCENGNLLLMETAQRSPSEAKVLARRDRLFDTDAWPHVVLADGRLFCKDRSGNVRCFAVK